MILTHFKQSLQSIRQNRLFSTIYIAGTALAIASTTVFAIVYYIKYAPVYPEYNRQRTATLNAVYYNPEHSVGSGIPYDLATGWLSKVDNADAVAMYYEAYAVPGRINYNDGKSNLGVNVKPVNTAYFEVFPFEFISGRAFSQAEFDGGTRVAAISDRIAEKVFGTTEGLAGKNISLNYTDYTITGVFREGSRLCRNSFAEIFIPYTVIPDYEKKTDISKMLITGVYTLSFLTDDPDALQSELNEIARRLNSQPGNEEDKETYYFDNTLKDNFAMAFEGDSLFERDDNSMNALIRKCLLILIVLLIVPALNLSGIIAGHMEERRGEIGVRKSFGATGSRMLSQILWENLVLTLFGGIIGLAAAWLIICFGGNWIFVSIGDFTISGSADVSISPEMLFAPAVFLFSFTLCLILNLLSSLLPAKLAVSKPIVETINSK